MATVFLALFSAVTVSAQVWRPMGPPGGDVRALAADPNDAAVLYLGTTDGHIFGSRDGGENWQILGRAGRRLDSVVAALIVDPRSAQVLYAGVWTLDGRAGGGVLRSDDAGRTWQPTGLDGQAVRALAQAPSEPDILMAGTLDGVYRSEDAGKSWKRISPADNPELRNLDSIAIDPRNPKIIYAGTFHLPWKTIDGGAHWNPIHAGMIDDSDVFSIVVDNRHNRRLYASACSGIYRSENGGALWTKIHGIPYSARRTHIIRQDPVQPASVYAGTTEGLWKTSDAGAVWRRLTPPNWIINALVLDPRREGRVIIGTEQLGILVSDDGGKNFRAANDGFYHRQIASLALDSEHPGRVLAILANSTEPVVVTENGGCTWSVLGTGLRAEGVRSLYAAPQGWWAALNRGGLMRYDAARATWVRAGLVVGEPTPARDRRGHRIRRAEPKKPRLVDEVVSEMAFSRDLWFAATPGGLFASRDGGASWSLFHFAPLDLPVSSVRASADGQKLWIVSLRGMVFSHDGGKTWSWHDLPSEAGGALRLSIADDETLLATARNGLYVSRDGGQSWRQIAEGLPQAPLQDLAIVGDVFLASMRRGGLYISYDRGKNWSRIEGTLADGYFPVVTTGPGAAVAYAGSATEGLYAVELEMLERHAAEQQCHR